MTENFFDTFIFLFVVLDPVGVFPIFVLLTQRETPPARHLLALRACLISFSILMAFAFGGGWLLDVLDISTAALQLAGGVLLFVIAMGMIMGKNEEAKDCTETSDSRSSQDIAIFPLSIPMLAGPGSLAAIVMKMRSASGDLAHQGAIIGALLLVMVLTYLLFRLAEPVTRHLGQAGVSIATRVFGIILAAVAFQLLLNGISGGVLEPLVQQLMASDGCLPSGNVP